MILAHTLGLWFLYVIVMWLKRGEAALRRRGGWRLLFAYLFVAVAWCLDVLYNVTWGTLMFLQPPHWRRLTFTARLKYFRQGHGRWEWQRDLADFFCVKMLNPFDPKKRHC